MTQVPKSSLPGFNVMLMGPAGSGKTHALGTLVDSGIEVFYLALEPGLESLLGYWTDRGLPIPANLHWHTLKAPDTSSRMQNVLPVPAEPFSTKNGSKGPRSQVSIAVRAASCSGLSVCSIKVLCKEFEGEKVLWGEVEKGLADVG